MATRHIRAADKAGNERNTKILKGLLQQPGNKYCADCKQKGKDPRWASWNLGIFICMRCSGIHRSLGVDISKVKSVDLDTWVTEQVENMVKWGNTRANKYWEANMKDRVPSEHSMGTWIRQKYQHKRFAEKGPIPDPSTLDDSEQTGSKPALPDQNTSNKQGQVSSKPALSDQSRSVKQDLLSLDSFLDGPSSAPVTPAAKPQASLDVFGDAFTTAPSSATTTPPKQDSSQGFKSKIMSLYNTAPSMPPAQQQHQQHQHQQQTSPGYQSNTSSYQNNMSLFQQQLSDLSPGWPSNGIIPQTSSTNQNGLAAQPFHPSPSIPSAQTQDKQPKADPFAGLDWMK